MNIDFPSVSDVPALRNLWKEAFGDTDSFLDKFFDSAFSVKRSRCTKSGSDIYAALYWFDCIFNNKNIAYIYAVATAGKMRGRGYCSMLMNNVHELLKEKGYAGIILVPASKHLFEFYGKMGYKTTAHKTNVFVNASDECVNVTEVSACEYARIRKKYLPENSVLQEGENLDFLSLMCRFYTGDGFCFVLDNTLKTFKAIEFLGDFDLAPHILNSFKVKSGEFVTFGNEIPFAMYLSLDESNDSHPKYFGFAFD